MGEGSSVEHGCQAVDQSQLLVRWRRLGLATKVSSLTRECRACLVTLLLGLGVPALKLCEVTFESANALVLGRDKIESSIALLVAVCKIKECLQQLFLAAIERFESRNCTRVIGRRARSFGRARYTADAKKICKTRLFRSPNLRSSRCVEILFWLGGGVPAVFLVDEPQCELAIVV